MRERERNFVQHAIIEVAVFCSVRAMVVLSEHTAMIAYVLLP